uniref:Uncharacterized protein n=1 Tax=Solanum lycopersicum TaxID=4081 RepID=A0A3Q7J0S9_SOLLC
MLASTAILVFTRHNQHACFKETLLSPKVFPDFSIKAIFMYCFCLVELLNKIRSRRASSKKIIQHHKLKKDDKSRTILTDYAMHESFMRKRFERVCTEWLINLEVTDICQLQKSTNEPCLKLQHLAIAKCNE